MECSGIDRKGFTLVEIMMVVAIIGLLAAIAMPSFIRARDTAVRVKCITDIRQMQDLLEQAALASDVTIANLADDAAIDAILSPG